MKKLAAIASFSLLLPASVYASVDSFKVQIPSYWKNQSTEPQYSIFQNTKNQGAHETIVTQRLNRISKDDSVQSTLETRTQDLTKIRAPFFRKMGLGNYTILEMTKRVQPKSGFGFYQEIQSRYLAIDGAETQMLERQYATRDSLYVVTYLIRGAALNNRAQANRLLDLVQPKKSNRVPASEIVNSEPAKTTAATSQPSKAEVSDVEKPKAIRYFDMESPEAQKLCDGIPTEERRKSTDAPGFNSLSEEFYKIKGCATGVVQSLWGMITSAASLLKWADDVTAIGESPAREQVYATVGIIAKEIKEDGIKNFAWRVGSGLFEAVSKEFNQFPCYSNAEQMRKVCAILGNAIPAGILVKLATRAALTVEEAAKLAGLMKKEIAAPAAKLIETTAKGERVYDAGGGVVAKVSDAIPSESEKIGRLASGELTASKALSEANAAPPSVRSEAVRNANAAIARFKKLKGDYGDLLPANKAEHAKLYELIDKAEKKGASKNKIRDTLRVEGARCTR